MAEIKAILFDKDGTLVDFNATWLAIGKRVALYAASGDQARADILLDQAGFDFASGQVRPDSVFAAGTNDELVALWYPHMDAVQRLDILRAFDRFFSSDEEAGKPVPVPGCFDAITSLHRAGLKLAVATNDSTANAERTLVSLGMAQLFDAVYGFDAVANPKPAADTIDAFCAYSGLKPSQVAMVGDNRHDLVMAKAGGAGLAVGVLSGTGTRETLAPLADVVLGSIADLPAFLKGSAAT